MTPERAFVRLFGVRGRELEGLTGLTGGTSATHLRNAELTAAAYGAVVEGLTDANPRVRWWCVQVLDHIPDSRAVVAIAPLLDDPVPRVRRVAAHALGCVACKPGWSGDLPREVAERLIEMAGRDPSPKVRAEAQWALAAGPAVDDVAAAGALDLLVRSPSECRGCV